LGVTALVRPALANPAPAIVEIDPRVELDARATRRLVQLEVADVDVPKRPQDPDIALFVRVIAEGEGRIRVELWERGEQHGARLVSGTSGGSQLIARRVALAAAELARVLRQKRRTAEQARVAEEKRKAAAERAERERTLDGPRAIRPALTGMLVGPADLAALGPSLAGQIHVAEATRLDFEASSSFGRLRDGGPTVQILELGMGPAVRLPAIPRALDLDFSAFAKAGVLTFGNVSSVDGIHGEHESWWARAGGLVAAELRLERTTRLRLGFSLGALLRHVPLTLEDGSERRLGGLFLGTELGVVFTPPGSFATP
jgi:hypothetical protein